MQDKQEVLEESMEIKIFIRLNITYHGKTKKGKTNDNHKQF
jgi:hypothetical protein